MESDARLDASLREATFEDLTRIVARGLPAGPDVEDAVQEAVVRAWLQIEDGRVLSAPKSWIIRTAHNLVIDQLRRRRSEDRAIHVLRAGSTEGVDPPGLDPHVEAALADVPPRQRLALEMHYLEDRSVVDIAERMGTSVGTVKSQLHRGRGALAASLRAQGEMTMEERGWFMGGSNPAHYEAGSSEEETFEGRPVVSFRATADAVDGEGFATLMQSIRADDYRNKRVRWTGAVRAEGVERWAALWMRVDPPGGGGHLAFDNMEDRPITGTADWQRYEVVLDVAEQADQISFGALLAGPGELRLSDFSLDEVGRDVDVTGRMLPRSPINLDFSTPVIA